MKNCDDVIKINADKCGVIVIMDANDDYNDEAYRQRATKWY